MIHELTCGRTLQRESLYGLEGVCLVEGLLTSRLQADVEEELSKASITVLLRSEVGLADPLLYINVNIHKLDELFFYSIHVELHQLVTLVRDPSIELQAPTWNVGSVGSVGSMNLYQIRGAVKKHIQTFIGDYQLTSVN